MVEAWHVLVEWTAWTRAGPSLLMFEEWLHSDIRQNMFPGNPISVLCHSCSLLLSLVQVCGSELQKVPRKQWVDWTKEGDACNPDAFTRLSTTSHSVWNRCHGHRQEREGTLGFDILTLNWVPECGEGVHRHLCKGDPLQECIFLLSFSPVWPI